MNYMIFYYWFNDECGNAMSATPVPVDHYLGDIGDKIVFNGTNYIIADYTAEEVEI